jgi:cell division septum initiation protein DivIVA
MHNFFAAAGLTAFLSGATPIVVNDPTAPAYAPAVVAHATVLTRALAQRIHFNEGQYVKVKALHLRMLAERKQLEAGLADASPADRDNWLATAQSRYEAELSALLQPEQRVAYQQLRSNFTAHRIN